MTSIKEEDKQVALLDYVSELLKEIAVTEGFNNFSFLSTVGSNPGQGISDILRVCISGQKNGKSDELYLVVKMPPTDEELRKKYMLACKFEREILMYNKILPLLINFQKEKGITDDHKGFLAFPKCYATLSDKTNDRYVIIMEDLRQMGHNMFDKPEFIDVQHIHLVLEELAKLHAISFAFRDQRPEEFEDLTKITEVYLDQVVIGSDFYYKEYILSSFNDYIETLEPTENEAIEIMTKFRDNFVNEMRECVGLGVAEPLSVISHGDAWIENFQFQYNESNAPEKVVLIDWQLSRYGSPVLDVVYFIFSSTIKPFRNELYDEIIRFYYDNLSAMIRRLGSDPNKLFSFDDFKVQLAKFGKFALLNAPRLATIQFAKDGESPDFKKLDTLSSTETRNEIKLSVTPIKDAIRLGYY